MLLTRLMPRTWQEEIPLFGKRLHNPPQGRQGKSLSLWLILACCCVLERVQGQHKFALDSSVQVRASHYGTS